MKAIGVMSPGEIKLVDVPKPEINDYECLVRMRACAYCNYTDTAQLTNTHIDRNYPFPHIQGHEGAGEIVEVGKKVKNFSAGDRIVYPEGRLDPGCGFAVVGNAHFSEYCIVRDLKEMEKDGIPIDNPFSSWPRKFPSAIEFTDAAVLSPIREQLSGVRNFGIGKGSRVLVFGDGPSGFGLAFFSKYVGAAWVGVAGHQDSRLAHAKEKGGADAVYNTNFVDPYDDIEPGSLDFVIDAAGSAEIIINASNHLKAGGKVGVYAGLRKDRRMIDFHEFANGVMLHKLFHPIHHLEVHEEVLDLISRNRLNPKDFYSHVMPMEQFKQAMDMTLSREAFKAVMTI
ncbi:MAG: zinc-binding dehydrogenase [Oscillospiraceae bacterium]